MKTTIRIGTRGSPLALKQTGMVCDALRAAHPGISCEVKIIQTSGEWNSEAGETRLTTKGEFTKEIEQALLAGEIDAAVHSMKDVETKMPDGLAIRHMLPREDVRDCLLFAETLRHQGPEIPAGATVGTASVRRQVFLSEERPDLLFSVLRGNVETRIKKVRSGQVDVTLLALAGLKRLGLESEADAVLDVDDMLPCAGQGAVGIQVRAGDDETAFLFDGISCVDTVLCVTVERGVLEAIDGTCDTPVGVYAALENGAMHVRARLFEGDMRFAEGKQNIETLQEARNFGFTTGLKLKA